MHFYELIKTLANNKEIIMYVDMDGVISSYDIGNPYDFENKRPLLTNINILEKIRAG